MGKHSQKPYLTDYNLLTVQDFWQPHYQIFLIIFLKEFIKLDVNIYMIMKNVEHAELNTEIATAFLNTQFLRMV